MSWHWTALIRDSERFVECLLVIGTVLSSPLHRVIKPRALFSQGHVSCTGGVLIWNEWKISVEYVCMPSYTG